ncbi:hypothetical protein OSTOST_16857, partial [Ostertagia ostertagi]
MAKVSSARAKELLANLPKIEKIVYNQCVRDSKSTVALAKCAVRVFDARDNAKMKAEEEAKREKKTKAVISIKAQRKSPLPMYKTGEGGEVRNEKEKVLPKYRFFARKSHPYRNPIRPQLRNRLSRLKKPANHVEKKYSTKDSLLKDSLVAKENPNVIPMIVESRMRVKRKIENDMSIARPSLNLREIALKYIKKMLGELRFIH